MSLCSRQEEEEEGRKKRIESTKVCRTVHKHRVCPWEKNRIGSLVSRAANEPALCRPTRKRKFKVPPPPRASSDPRPPNEWTFIMFALSWPWPQRKNPINENDPLVAISLCHNGYRQQWHWTREDDEIIVPVSVTKEQNAYVAIGQQKKEHYPSTVKR